METTSSTSDDDPPDSEIIEKTSRFTTKFKFLEKHQSFIGAFLHSTSFIKNPNINN